MLARLGFGTLRSHQTWSDDQTAKGHSLGRKKNKTSCSSGKGARCGNTIVPNLNPTNRPTSGLSLACVNSRRRLRGTGSQVRVWTVCATPRTRYEPRQAHYTFVALQSLLTPKKKPRCVEQQRRSSTPFGACKDHTAAGNRTTAEKASRMETRRWRSSDGRRRNLLTGFSLAFLSACTPCCSSQNIWGRGCDHTSRSASLSRVGSLQLGRRPDPSKRLAQLGSGTHAFSLISCFKAGRRINVDTRREGFCNGAVPPLRCYFALFTIRSQAWEVRRTPQESARAAWAPAASCRKSLQCCHPAERKARCIAR